MKQLQRFIARLDASLYTVEVVFKKKTATIIQRLKPPSFVFKVYQAMHVIHEKPFARATPT